MKNPIYTVRAKFRRPDGSEFVTSNNVRGKSAMTRWLNAMVKNNAGYALLDSWCDNDGRGLDSNGKRA